MIQSHELPERMVEMNGVRKYRVNVKEVVREDSVVYTYEEVEFDANIPVEISDAKVAKIEAEIATQQAKLAKQQALDSITVEVEGLVFDGRDKDQARMIAALKAAEVLGLAKAEWKLADDTIKEIDVDTLEVVLAMAIQEVGRIVREM